MPRKPKLKKEEGELLKKYALLEKRRNRVNKYFARLRDEIGRRTERPA